MKKVKLLWLSILLSLVMLAGCGSSEPASTETTAEPEKVEETSTPEPAKEEKEETEEVADTDPETWAVYWYICGSNLESEGGAATMDLGELEEAKLPDNVTFVVETGGAKEWMNDLVDADELGRFVCTSDGFEKVDAQDLASMGETDTLVDFLSFCETNYPADHSMVLFWNHGGGSMGGAEYDELFDEDHLTLPELNEAFSTIYEEKQKKYDIIGFDTCLMATLENASIMSNYADYMIASEELEPGNGWNYTGFGNAFAKNPGISAKDLGIAICDAYEEGCKDVGTFGEATLSVTDLSKVDTVISSMDLASLELIAGSLDNTSVPGLFIREGYKAENYGGNNDQQGYFNQVDLGDLADKTAELIPDSASVLQEAISEAVVYKVNGKYRKQSTGLSMFFPYGIGEGMMETYHDELTVNPLYSCFLQYIMDGEYPEDTMDYYNAAMENIDSEVEEETQIDEDAVSQATSVSTFSGNMEVYEDEDGYFALQVDPDETDTIASVYFNLYIVDAENDVMILLGSDNNLNSDWDNGAFSDNFSGTWGCLDGMLCYMELTYEGDDYTLYSVPIRLNDEDMVMRVAYNYDEEAYQILGAIPSDAEENGGAASKNLIEIKAGDVIEPMLYAMSLESDSDELVPFYMDPVTVTEDTVFADEDIGEGDYMYMYGIDDLAGNTYYSDIAYMSYKDGMITLESIN